MEIPIDEIEVADGTNLDKDKYADIRDSIKDQGLLHAITVLNTNGSYKLVTGRYRLMSAKELGWTSIECNVKEGLDDIQQKEIHLHENLKRGRLEWYDEVALVKELHELRQTQHGAAPPYRPTGGQKTGWSVRDTAEELGKALGPVSEDLQLARMVQQNPSLRNIKDKSTAKKVVRQTSKRIFAEQEATVSGDVPFADQIFLGDSTSILEQFPENSFDFSITDPPWWKFAKQEDPTLRHDEFTLPVFKALYRVMKWDSFLYLFAGEEDFTYYKKELPPMGWKVQGHPCIWAKDGFLSRTGVRSWEHGRDLELILVAVKGNPVLSSSTQVSSIYRRAVVPSRLLIHPHEKPVELIMDIQANCSYRGSLGIDPFAGSGAHLAGMISGKRHYVGIERDPDRYKKIVERMERFKT